jgi:hypothetical protein
MKIRQLLYLTILVFGVSAGAFAQERAITKKEFDDAQTASLSKLNGVSYRRTSTFGAGDENGKVAGTTIEESVPPDRKRTLTVMTEGENKGRTETIAIGKKTYFRKDDGLWAEKNESDTNRYTVMGSADLEEIKSYTFLPSVKVGNETADLIREDRTFIFKNSDGSAPDKTLMVSRHWIDKAGRPLRTEYETTELNTGAKRRQVLVYEYDPNIKIKAPKVRN